MTELVCVNIFVYFVIWLHVNIIVWEYDPHQSSENSETSKGK